MCMGGQMMTFNEAREMSKNGEVIFFTMGGFCKSESIHFYKRKAYFEDGVRPDDYWLDEFATDDKAIFYIKCTQETIDLDKFNELHQRMAKTNYLLSAWGESFENCIKEVI